MTSDPSAWTVSVGATPGPERPELREGLDPLDVSPGVLGFLVIFLVVLACIPLFRSMTSKLRGVEYRGRRDEAAWPDGPDRARPSPTRDDDATPDDGRGPGAAGR